MSDRAAPGRDLDSSQRSFERDLGCRLRERLQGGDMPGRGMP